MVVYVGHEEVRVYRGTGVSRRVRRTTWDRSLKNWELQIPCFKEFSWGENTLGLVPASLPHTLGYACTFYAPTSPPPSMFFSLRCLDTLEKSRMGQDGLNLPLGAGRAQERTQAEFWMAPPEIVTDV